jgi:hypothetical protein
VFFNSNNHVSEVGSTSVYRWEKYSVGPPGRANLTLMILTKILRRQIMSNKIIIYIVAKGPVIYVSGIEQLDFFYIFVILS